MNDETLIAAAALAKIGKTDEQIEAEKKAEELRKRNEERSIAVEKAKKADPKLC